MSHRGRLARFIPLVALMGLALTMLLSAPLIGQSPVEAQGNSQNAKACQNGGWQNLQDSEGVPFSSMGECVRSGAQGLGVETPVPPPPPPVLSPVFAFSFAYTGEGVNRLCTPTVHMTGFESGTRYEFKMDVRSPGTDDARTLFKADLGTDENGATSFSNPMSYTEGQLEMQAQMGGFSSDWIPYDC